MTLKKNDHAISLKYSIKVDPLFSLIIAQKGIRMPLPLKEKSFTLTLNGDGKLVNLSCLLLLPPIRMGESPTGT